MRNGIGLFVAALGAMALCGFAAATGAAEIKIVSAAALKEVLDDLGPKFERASGHKLAVSFATQGEIVKMLKAGESADVVLIQRQNADALVKEGKAAAGNVNPLARSHVVLVVRKGAPKPDISSPEALKRALLAAKSVSYTDPALGGASSAHFVKVLERLGIEKEMKAKTVHSGVGGDTAVQVANGKAELGINQQQVMMPVAGIEVVGPLPGDLQSTQHFAATVMNGARDSAAAKALVSFLRTPEAAKVFRAKGMDPG